MTSLSYMNQKDASLSLCFLDTENDETKFNVMLTLAESGDLRAQRWVADSYYYGQGVEQNQKIALNWYMKAARNGDPIAKSFIGLCSELTKSNLETLDFNTHDWFEQQSLI